jgi:lipopolysaccharide export system permease protein
MTLLQKMILREILVPFLFSFLGLSAFLVVGKLFSFLDAFFQLGVELHEIPRMIWIMLPALWLFILPMATLLGILMAFLRMSRDSEIIALLASGIRPRQILKPVVFVSFVLCMASLLVSIYLLPGSKASVREFLGRLTETILSRGVPEQTFFSPLKDLTLYVHETRNEGKVLNGVFIRDAREAKASGEGFSQEGELYSSPETKEMILKLKKGTIIRVSDDYKMNDKIQFDEYILKLSLAEASKKINRGEMSLSELKKEWEDPKTPKRKKKLFQIEFNNRLAVPLATFIFGILAMPLGIYFGRAGLAGGVAIGLGAFLSYYLSMAFASNMAKAGAFSPFISIWMPDIAFFSISILLIIILERKGPIRG